MQKSLKYFKKITVCVVRITNTGFRSSSPCENCLSLMKKLNVRKIMYSENGELKYEKIRDYKSYGFCTATRYLNT